jgi:tetratricopeptide (TPR) repeat protein
LAIANASEALRLGYQPKSVKELQWLIDSYAENKNYIKLIEVCENAVSINPHDPNLYATLATAYTALGVTDRAKLASTNWLIWHYWETHEYRKLAQVYETEVQIKPNDSTLYDLATVYAILGEKDEAGIAAQKALKMNPALESRVRMLLRSVQP